MTSKRITLYLLTLNTTCSYRAPGALPALLWRVPWSVSRQGFPHVTSAHLLYCTHSPTLRMLTPLTLVGVISMASGRTCAEVCCVPSQWLPLRYSNAESDKSYLLNISFSYQQGKMQVVHGQHFWRNLGCPTFNLKFGRGNNDGHCRNLYNSNITATVVQYRFYNLLKLYVHYGTKPS